ncbi:MAG TPA: hypothetical protein VFZ24_02920 [Longimicrobiales bacterium]
MSTPEPVSLGNIIEAIEETIHGLNRLGYLEPDREKERTRIIAELEYLKRCVGVIPPGPCGSFFPLWKESSE